MIPESVRRSVRERAEDRCEYCQMSQALQGANFHVEHIVPLSKGGATVEENLALACPSCNLGKADATEGADLATGQRVPLYHPRRDRWTEHFRIEGVRIFGVTAVGRATVVRLQINGDRRLRIRELERSLGWWPPHATEARE